MLQQISKNARPIYQVQNTTFYNDINVTNKCNLMKDRVKDIVPDPRRAKPENTNHHLN